MYFVLRFPGGKSPKNSVPMIFSLSRVVVLKYLILKIEQNRPLIAYVVACNLASGVAMPKLISIHKFIFTPLSNVLANLALVFR